MFRIAITILLSLFLFTKNVNAQTLDTVRWCPPGATWVYEIIIFGSQDYYLLSYIKDTVVLGKAAKQMQSKRIRYNNYGTWTRTESLLGKEYFYNSNDSIYFLDTTAFKFIYSFNPQIGDVWRTSTSRYNCSNVPFAPKEDTFHIIGFDTVTMAGKKYKLIKDSSANKNYRMGNILKNIGAYESPFPFINTNKCVPPGGAIDISFINRLVCYSDNLRGSVITNYGGSFDCHSIITSIDNTNLQETSFHLYPNPVKNNLFIKGIGAVNIFYSISDALGKIILSGKLVKNEIDVAALSAGCYFIQLTSRSKTFSSKFIKF